MIITDRVFEFLEEGVWVTVPTQALPDVSLRVWIEKVALTEAMWGQEDFQPLRVIGNLKAEGEPLRGFDPPVQVRVRYTCMDLFRAMRRGKPLALAYWAGEVWVRFDELHRFRVEPPDPCAYAYLELTEIGDPAIAWGT